MKKELELKLQKDYPQIFRELYGDPSQTCMADGVATGDGWFDIIHQLCADLTNLDLGPDFCAAQIKEKFGLLRIYLDGVPESKQAAVYKLLDAAETESSVTCENCGSKEGVTTEATRSWIQSLCPMCRSDRK